MVYCQHNGGKRSARAIAICFIGLLWCGPFFEACAARKAVDLDDVHIKWALAHIESGAIDDARCKADYMRGTHREVSRYQVLPALWHNHTASADYANPTLAWNVARQILKERTEWFRRKTGRQPGAFDLYVMWNAPGHYHKMAFKAHRVSPVVAERARRFAALMESCGARSFVRM